MKILPSETNSDVLLVHLNKRESLRRLVIQEDAMVISVIDYKDDSIEFYVTDLFSEVLFKYED